MDSSRSIQAIIGRCLLILGFGAFLGSAATAALAADYQSLIIVSPQSEATIHNNSGRVDIEVAVSPLLNVDAGDRLVFVIDGVPFPPSRRSHLTLQEMDRGSHTIQVQIINDAGNMLIASVQRTMYLWRASALLPNRVHP
jgi:hypothetical protein